MLRFCVLLALTLCGTVLVHAQTINTTWWALVNSTRINDRFSTHFDGQWRSGDNYSTMSSLILRPGLNYKVNSRFTATLGYAYIANRRSYQLTGTGVDPVSISGYVPEHRIFQQAVYVHPIFGKNTISHRARLEQRFLMTPSIENNKVSTDGNTYANRFRYFFRSVIPFKQEFPYNKGWFGAIQNEVMVNFGDKSNVNGKVFDQNRLMLSSGYRLSPAVDLEIGYMNQYVNGRAKTFVNNHIIQVAAYTRL